MYCIPEGYQTGVMTILFQPDVTEMVLDDVTVSFNCTMSMKTGTIGASAIQLRTMKPVPVVEHK